LIPPQVEQPVPQACPVPVINNIYVNAAGTERPAVMVQQGLARPVAPQRLLEAPMERPAQVPLAFESPRSLQTEGSNIPGSQELPLRAPREIPIFNLPKTERKFTGLRFKGPNRRISASLLNPIR
jgi:hypothetical protein